IMTHSYQQYKTYWGLMCLTFCLLYPSFPLEFVKYQKKLSISVSAQSRFLSTYGGTSHMPLDDIYTEVQLELPNNSAEIYKSMGFEDIVGPVGTLNEDADTVLVSGEAGSGKSTWLQKLHLLWAQGSALQDFLLLFPFSCRRLNSEHKDLSVQELLFQHCCWPDREQEEIFQFILDHPHLVLFTFDGLDELKQSFVDEHRICCPNQRAPVHVLLFNLIQGSLMKGVRKVVTSRPEAVAPALKKHLHKEVHLKGFSPSGIDCFVRKHHSDPNEAAMVLESLQANTALLGLCHSPVLCWIVSQCHKELLGCGEGSPQTVTDVYLMILQHFFQHHSTFKLSIGVSWLQQNLGTVLHLGQLAFEGISNFSYIFSVADLEICGVTESDICMGFLIQSKNMSPAHSKYYEFLHITMQCFFAAIYVILSSNTGRSAIPKLFELQEMKKNSAGCACFGACLHSSNTQKILEEHSTTAETPNLQITATFVSGLLSQRYQKLWLHCSSSVLVEKKARQAARCLSKGMQQHFRSIPQPVQGEKKSMHAMPEFVWLIKCIYEMQESRIAKDAMSKLEVDHLKLTYCNIGPVECTALAYVLKHLKYSVGLQLDNNSTSSQACLGAGPPICHAAMSSALWSQEKPSGGFREDWRFYMVVKECTVEKPQQKTLRIPRGSLGQSCQERNSLGRTLPPCKGKKSLRILDQTNVVLSLDERDVVELDEKLAELLFPITNCEERCNLLCDEERLERVRDIDCGSKVRVQLRSGDKPLPGVVRFKGSLLPDRALSGIWFGVELLEEGRGLGFTEGSYQGRQLFRCEEECGVFVALDKLELWEDDDDESLSQLEVNQVRLEDDQDYPPLEINSRVVLREEPERGTVIFCDFLPGNETLGYYVGVDMDNPIGNWDGMIEGKLVCNFASLEHTRLVPIGDVMPGESQRLCHHFYSMPMLLELLVFGNLQPSLPQTSAEPLLRSLSLCLVCSGNREPFVVMAFLFLTVK
ncbi:hypothetical protein GOODEAATRI_004560, partial [Goodea atripinnis]